MSEKLDLIEFLPLVQPPERLTAIESWHRHMPFAMVLLGLLRPGVLVELGTHRGDSYSAFCQGVVHQGLATRCFAVDTWQGDSQAGLYGDEILADLAAWHDPRYSSFSSLLRMTFDEALERFADGTVDLLHIDGLHTYDAVRHDFETWLPKMSRQGVVLFHDTVVRHSDFEVWRLWQDLEKQYPSFEFSFGFGLGVLAVGDAVPKSVLDFLAYARSNPKVVTDFFHQLGDSIALRRASTRIAALGEQVESLGGQLTHARHVVEERDAQLQAACPPDVHFNLLRDFEAYRSAMEADRSFLRTYSDQATAQVRVAELISRSRLWRGRNRLMRLLGQKDRVLSAQVPSLPTPSPSGHRPIIDVIVPVYRNFELTQRCIESVLCSDIATEFELVVINDCSPDPDLADWLDQQAAAGRFTLLKNEFNRGFVQTVNLGMALHPERDVVLLNSDAEVANDWLDRLQSVAYSEAGIGSVTPFSNNATICSYPVLCADNELPEGFDLASLDRVFREVNAGVKVDLPTAVGFCMFIRRACLEQSGPFNAELFGRGYGEENEFCMRSAQLGWRHVLAADTFVRHEGGVSFAETQSENQRVGRKALLGAFPQYDLVIRQHVEADPVAHVRFATDLAVSRSRGLPIVLMISHKRGGGTARHLEMLIAQLEGQATVYELVPVEEGGLVSLGLHGDGHARMVFDPFADLEALVATLEALGVARIHIHHTIGLAAPVFTLPERLQCPYDMTVHDYYLVCPQDSMTDAQGRYCGAPDAAGCNRCLAERPAPGGVDIAAWRRFGEVLLGGAERVFVPSQDTERRMRRYVDKARYIHAIHETGDLRIPVVVKGALPEKPLKVVVLGALGIIKGADLLEAVALEARAARAPVEFHLLGYSYRKLRCKPFSALEVHGAYQEAELAGLLKELDADVAWFPGSCPETYSYTLSACLRAGLPVVAPQIGAFPERLAERDRTWLFQVDPTPSEMLALLLEVREQLIKGAPVSEVQSESRAAEFDYTVGYCVELAASKIEPLDPASWQSLYGVWKSLATMPRGKRAPERFSSRVVRFVIRQPWAQPLLVQVPHGLRARIKRLIFRA